jgi:hypothetical protein
MSFWLTFAISEALTVAGLFVSKSGLTAEQKAAFEQFITSGNALLTLL